jgi:hypothetical protein
MAFTPAIFAKLNCYGPNGVFMGSIEAQNKMQYDNLMRVVGDSVNNDFIKTVNEAELKEIKNYLASATHSCMFLRTPFAGMDVTDVAEHKQYIVDCLTDALALAKKI